MQSSRDSNPTVCPGPKGTMRLWGLGTMADAILIGCFALVFPIFNTGFTLDAASYNLGHLFDVSSRSGL